MNNAITCSSKEAVKLAAEGRDVNEQERRQARSCWGHQYDMRHMCAMTRDMSHMCVIMRDM